MTEEVTGRRRRAAAAPHVLPLLEKAPPPRRLSDSLARALRLAQRSSPHLPARRPRERRPGDAHFARYLVRRQRRAAVRAERLRQPTIGGRRSLHQPHYRYHSLTPLAVALADHRSLGHARVRRE